MDNRIFVLLKDPQDVKPSKFHFFTKDYLTDGSERLIQENLLYGLNDFIDGEAIVYEKEYPYIYWVYTPKSYFIQSYATPDLVGDVRTFEEFKKWYEAEITSWANLNRLPFKVLRDKVGEYVLKIIITVS